MCPNEYCVPMSTVSHEFYVYWLSDTDFVAATLDACSSRCMHAPLPYVLEIIAEGSAGYDLPQIRLQHTINRHIDTRAGWILRTYSMPARQKILAAEDRAS